MTLEEYFAQDKYFSESEGELLDLDDMPYQHVYYAGRKLFYAHGTLFLESRLGQAFRERLSPSAEQLVDQLRRYGKATLSHNGNTTPIRSRLYYAAKRAGVKVTTHKEEKWVTGTVVTDTKVRVKGERVT